MNKILKQFLMVLALVGFSISTSKAFIVDVWEVRGANPQELHLDHQLKLEVIIQMILPMFTVIMIAMKTKWKLQL